MKNYLYIHCVCKIHKRPLDVVWIPWGNKVLKHNQCTCEDDIQLDSMKWIEATIYNNTLHI